MVARCCNELRRSAIGSDQEQILERAHAMQDVTRLCFLAFGRVHLGYGATCQEWWYRKPAPPNVAGEACLGILACRKASRP